MMNTFPTTGITGVPSALLWLHLHWLAGGAAIIGAILFTVWALRNLQGNVLRTLALWLMIGGSVVILLTAPLAGGAILLLLGRGNGMHHGGMMNSSSMGAMMRMMEMMDAHDSTSPSPDHTGIRDAMMDMLQEAGDRPGMMDQ